MFIIILASMALGAVIGFMAGLLGIGGGVIAVPALLYLLPKVGLPSAYVAHTAIATSLAAVVLTSLSSTRAHHLRGNVSWPLLKKMLPGFILGSLSASFLAHFLSAKALEGSFAIFVMMMAIRLLMVHKVVVATRPLPNNYVLVGVSAVIAVIAALMGIGGGVLLVPFLGWCGMQMRYAIGCSSATGMIIALFGSIGYIATGWDVTGLPDYMLGYIYLPVLLGIVSTSTLMAPVGVKMATRWPTSWLRRIFAALLLLTGVKLLLF